MPKKKIGRSLSARRQSFFLEHRTEKLPVQHGLKRSLAKVSREAQEDFEVNKENGIALKRARVVIPKRDQINFNNDLISVVAERNKKGETADCGFQPCFGKPHPLHIPALMNQIFKILPFEELKTCRSVCKEWESEIFRLMRQNVMVEITSYKRLRDYFNNFLTRKEFCDQFEFGRGLNMGAPTMVKFFQNFGSSIKTVSFQLTKWKESDFTNLLFSYLTNVEDITVDCFVPKANENGHYFERHPDGIAIPPGDKEMPRSKLLKLKQLNLNVRALETSYAMNLPQSPVRTFLLDLFKIAPNLERITCPASETSFQPLEFLIPMDHAHMNHLINGEVLDALDELNGMGFESNMRRVLFDALVSSEDPSIQLNKLSIIDMNLTLREEHVRRLHFKHFPLKSIDIIVTQNITLNTLHGFLSSIGATLKKLALRFLRRSNCTTEFPSSVDLKHLEDLTLNGFKGSLRFLQNFQQLKRFILVKPPNLSVVFPLTQFDFGQFPLTNLETIEISEIEKPSRVPNYGPQLIQKFASNFPNLKRLGLENVGDATLRSIYSHLPNIEELILKYGVFTDRGIVGVNQNICDEIRSRDKLGEEEYILQREFPFIGNLRKLRVLELMSKEMTDVGFILGIAYCPALTRLSMTAYGITDKALYKILEDMPNLDYIRTDYCSQITLHGLRRFETDIKKRAKEVSVSINEYDGPMTSSEMWKFLKRNNGLTVRLHRLPL